MIQIDYVEFERHGAGGSSVSSHYFDLLVKLKSEQEHLFRNIQRNEYHNLFNFIRYLLLLPLFITFGFIFLLLKVS
jgi:Histone chaperone Rttp106-like